MYASLTRAQGVCKLLSLSHTRGHARTPVPWHVKTESWRLRSAGREGLETLIVLVLQRSCLAGAASGTPLGWGSLAGRVGTPPDSHNPFPTFLHNLRLSGGWGGVGSLSRSDVSLALLRDWMGSPFPWGVTQVACPSCGLTWPYEQLAFNRNDSSVFLAYRRAPPRTLTHHS